MIDKSIILADVLDFYNHFSDDVSQVSEWGHYFFCELDGARLKYDRHHSDIFYCQLCNKAYDDDKYRRVWRTFYRNDAFTTAYKAAMLFCKDGNKQMLEVITDIFDFYSDNYQLFPEHCKSESVTVTGTGQLGAGKIMPQELNEAIIAMRLAHTIELVKNYLNPAWLKKIKQGFVDGVYKLLKPQINRIHNIPFWCSLTIAALGHVFDDLEMVHFAYEGEFGIRRQMKEGVTKDGFWHEGSIHYNYFILEGIVFALALSNKYKYPITEEKAIAEKMLTTGYFFAFDNDLFPNPNDGWPNINLKTYAFTYHLAATFMSSQIKHICDAIMSGSLPRTPVPLSEAYHLDNKYSIEHLLYWEDYSFNENVRIFKESYHLADTNFAMIRNDVYNVFIKYGHKVRSHAHPDKMNIELTAYDKLILHDLSNTGYGAAICNQWHRTSAAHNTIVVDGQSHQDIQNPGICHSFSKHHVEVESVPYLGIRCVRKLELNEQSFIDLFRVIGNNGKNVDYFLHLRAELLTDVKKSASSLGYQENGYQHIKNIYHLEHKSDYLELEYVADFVIINLSIAVANKEVFIGQSLDNPVNCSQSALIIRSKEKDPVFNITWSVRRKV